MATRQGRRPPLKPSVVPLVIGIGLAVVTAGLGDHRHGSADRGPLTRAPADRLLQHPECRQGALLRLLPLFFLAAGWFFSQRVQNWERGQPDRRATTTKNVKRRLADLRAGLYMQTLLRDPAAGVMHSLIYFPFLILFAVTTVLTRSTTCCRAAPSSSTARSTRPTRWSATPPACCS